MPFTLVHIVDSRNRKRSSAPELLSQTNGLLGRDLSEDASRRFLEDLRSRMPLKKLFLRLFKYPMAEHCVHC